MRGKEEVYNGHDNEARIIPAGAGKRATGLLRSASRQDHPRGCGEKWLFPARPQSSPGSSPRVRGKAAPYVYDVADARIIPAGAGKSTPTMIANFAAKDHPRGCGEKRSA